MWSDPNAAYHYALCLNADGRTGSAADICQRIIHQFPSSPASVKAKAAIAEWGKVLPSPGYDIGIVGFKFVISRTSQWVVINKVFPDTPAADAGLRIGDALFLLMAYPAET
jgi:S1-C subfamily serine protease